MPTKINLHIDPKKRIEQNRAALRAKAEAKRAGTYVEPKSDAAWKAATKSAEVRAGMTADALEHLRQNPDKSAQALLSRSSKIGAGGRAAGASLQDDLAAIKTEKLSSRAKAVKYQNSLQGTKHASSGLGRFEAKQVREWAGADARAVGQSKMSEHHSGFEDLGEKSPGASKAQVSRTREVAKSLREKRSSVTKAQPKSEKPWTPKGAVATSAGQEAGATTLKGRVKDLGRIAAKVLKGAYGEVSTKTAGKIKTAHLDRAAASIKGLGSTLGAAGTVSQAFQASKAVEGMKHGQALNPITLETSPEDPNKTYLTLRGKRKGRKSLGLGA